MKEIVDVVLVVLLVIGIFGGAIKYVDHTSKIEQQTRDAVNKQHQKEDVLVCDGVHIYGKLAKDPNMFRSLYSFKADGGREILFTFDTCVVGKAIVEAPAKTERK